MLVLAHDTLRPPAALRQRIAGIGALLILVNLGIWVWAALAFRDRPVLLGTALLAYGLGLRHAVDADHIAAIDNATRKLMQMGKRPVAVGLFFSLGHSSVVILAAADLRHAVSAQAGQQGARAGQGQGAPVTADQKTAPVKITKREYDKKALLSAPQLSESEQIGRAIFQQRCAYCHDGVGQPTYKTMGDWLGSETVQALGAEAMKAFINTGTTRMPGFQYNLDSKQMDDLIAFIKTIPSSEKPTQNQLDGKAAALDSND